MNDARLGRIFGNVTEAIGYLGIISLLSAIVLAVLNYGFDYDVGYAQNIALAVFLFALASWISIVSVRVKFFPHVDVGATPGDNGARQSESTRSVQSGPQTSHTHGRHPYDSAVDAYSERVARMETGSRDADSLAKKLFNEGRLSHIESESGDVVGIRISGMQFEQIDKYMWQRWLYTKLEANLRNDPDFSSFGDTYIGQSSTDIFVLNGYFDEEDAKRIFQSLNSEVVFLGEMNRITT